MTPDTQGFLDPDHLLSASMPRARYASAWAGAAMIGVVGLLIFTSLGTVGGFGQIVGGALMLGLLFTSMTLGGAAMRKIVAEQQKVQAVHELVTLRRWPDAAAILQEILCRPMRTQGGRLQALVYLAGVLGRYHRFEDAIAVYSYLLDAVAMDSRTANALKLGRAMCMLRNDQLFDADRAIADLRKQVRRGGSVDLPESADFPEDGDQPSPGPALADGAGLAVLEMYRDVKTGHPQEAVEIFEKSRDEIRRHFGHRVADAYALAARAYDLLGRHDEARLAFENATLLAPLLELKRRYPEIAPLEGKYPAAREPYGNLETQTQDGAV